jgi:hypothetical protein
VGYSYAISALSDKRAEIAGLILDLEKQVAGHRASLAHIDAVLHLLDPTIKPAAIRAKGRMAERSGYFDLGELSARCLDGAREAGEGGVSPDDLAVKAMRIRDCRLATSAYGRTSSAAFIGRSGGYSGA